MAALRQCLQSAICAPENTMMMQQPCTLPSLLRVSSVCPCVNDWPTTPVSISCVHKRQGAFALPWDTGAACVPGCCSVCSLPCGACNCKRQ